MAYRLTVFLRLLLAAILAVLTFTGAVPPTIRAAAPPEYLIADAGDAQALDWLQSSGAVQVTDYGAFSLWELPQPLGQDLGNRSIDVEAARPAGLRSSSGSILLRDITLSTNLAQPEPALPDALRQPALAGDGFWLVQFAGPALKSWLDALRAAGLEIVAYLPENAYVIWGLDPSARLSEVKEIAGLVRWQGAYHPAYRLHPSLRQSAETAQPGEIDVIVQVYATPALQDTVARLEELSSAAPSSPQAVLNLTNLRLRLPAGKLADLASWADVFNIEPYTPPQLLDEIQGQVLAGNITTAGGVTTASGPGYLAWLNSKGFSTNPADYPIVDVIDDGIDIGDAANVQHPDFYLFGSTTNADRVAYIANCTPDASGNAVGGHGNLNAGIIGGYNDLTGFPNENAAGYQYGLGISPYGRIAGTKIFRNTGPNDASLCGNSDTTIVYNAYSQGARITSDSWGASAAGAYNAYAQIYDFLTRDASAAGGNQAMLHVFAAGNDGSPLSPPPAPQSTINSPGSAKNVLTVGASENPRDNTVSCNGWTNSDNADDITPYSSRGRTADGRAKPDIIAPGTHVQGPASQDPGYQGTFVCTPKYYPGGQTLYAWSSGTSHSTPAIAGGAQLAYEYYKRVLAPGQNPSPAMLKALLLNSPRYLTGLAANDTLPGPAQGWGMLDLGRLFDAAPRMLNDQATLLTSSGQVYSVDASVVDPNKPLRVSLVWTDTPGNPVSAKALVNDLDLEVTVGATVYKGNVFSGSLSTPGGAADALNNVENVYLPAGTLGNLEVRVIARTLAGDGVPGVGTSTDQDFALVVYNATGELIPSLSISAVRRYPVVGNANSSVEPGETVDLEIDLANLIGSGAALGVSASLSVLQGTASVLQAHSGYPDLLPDGVTHTNLARYRVAVDPSQPCGGLLSLALTVTYAGGQVTFYLPDIVTSLPVQFVQTFTYAGSPIPIPDRVGGDPAVPVLAPIIVGDTSPIQRLTVTLDITHPFVGDFNFEPGCTQWRRAGAGQPAWRYCRKFRHGDL